MLSTALTAKTRLLTLTLALTTAIFLSFTIFFAYNSSSETPNLTLLIFQRPETSILVLTVALHLTIVSLAELTSSVLDATRWALASTFSGTSALTFLALSRATSFIGAFYLTFMGRTHRGLIFWGSQRFQFPYPN